MKKRKKDQRLARRNFLKQAGFAAGAAGAAVATASGARAAEAPEEKRKSLGYRESEHVKTYYELAKF